MKYTIFNFDNQNFGPASCRYLIISKLLRSNMIRSTEITLTINIGQSAQYHCVFTPAQVVTKSGISEQTHDLEY